MPIDIGPRRGFSSPLDMTGLARDIRTGATGRRRPGVTVLAEVLGGGRLRHGPATDVAGDDTGRLVGDGRSSGRAPGEGSGATSSEVVPGAEAGSLLRQVLDDMPAAALISGYAWMRLARREGHDPSTLTPAGIAGPDDRPVLGVAGRRCSRDEHRDRSRDAHAGLPAGPGATARTPWAWHGSDPSSATGCAAGGAST